MLVRAARPTASSTFSGYRYVPAGNLGPAGVPGEGTVSRRKSGRRRIRGERERERKRERAQQERGSGGAPGGAAAPRSRGSAEERRGPREFAPTSPQRQAAPGPRGARLSTRARRRWYLLAGAAVHLARSMCRHWWRTRVWTPDGLGPLYCGLAEVRRNARVPVRVRGPLPTST